MIILSLWRNNTLKAPIHGTGGDGVGFIQADHVFVLSHKQICNILVG